jgi:hypothetical protein
MQFIINYAILMIQTALETAVPARHEVAIFVGNGDFLKNLQSLEKFRICGKNRSILP